MHMFNRKFFIDVLQVIADPFRLRRRWRKESPLCLTANYIYACRVVYVIRTPIDLLSEMETELMKSVWIQSFENNGITRRFSMGKTPYYHCVFYF